ncbi:putative ribonuclease H-like domain-containing protein [Tanacetum coccineum]
MKSGLVSVNTDRQVNVAHPKTTVNVVRPIPYLSKKAHSTVKRPIHKKLAFKNSKFNQRVNTVKNKNVNTARPKAVVNVVQGNNVNVGNPQMDLQDIRRTYWLFDIDAPNKNNNYEPIVVKEHSHNDLKSSQDDGFKPSSDNGKKVDEDSRKDSEGIDQEKEDNVNSTNNVNAASTNEVNAVGGKTSIELPLDPNMPELEDYSIFEDDEDVGAEADMNNLDTTIQVSPIPTTRIHKDHPLDQVIGDLQSATQTRRMSKNLEEHGFIEAMQEELLQFKLQEVWTLVDLPNRKRAIGTKWVFRNKKDERGIVIRNKARLVAQGYTQEEGIDYDEVFAPVARIEAIRLFLSCSQLKIFMVNQMDVESSFLYRKIKEEVYVCQPPGFEDPNFPVRVYNVEKAMYGLHQALRAWYKGDILLVQVYVDDIIFGSTKKELCKEFEKLMHEKFHMSSMQCKKQTELPNSTTEAEYAKTVNEEVQLQALVDGKKTIITESIVRRDLQLEDADGVDCLPNATIFEQLTLMGSKTTAWNEFSSTMTSAIICLATNQMFNFSKYIFESMVKNLDNVSRKFLMYPRFVQVFVNQQLEGMPTHKRIYIAASHTKKIFGNMRRVGKGFFGRETPLFQTMMVQDQEEIDEAINKEMDDTLERAATTVIGLEAKQDSGNIDKTQSKATLNESSSSRTSSGSGPRHQETMGDTIAQTRSENVSKHSNDPLLAIGNTLRSGEDRLKLEELMALCTTLQSRVLALETTKTTQAIEIASLKKRVKKLERRNKLRTHGLKRLYIVGSSTRTDEDMFGVNDLDGDEVIVESIDVVKIVEETRSVVEEVTIVTIPVSADTTTTTTTAIIDVEMTLAQALAELKSAKPKATTITTTPTLTTTTAATTITSVSTRPRAKGLVIHEQEQAPTPTVSSQQPS